MFKSIISSNATRKLCTLFLMMAIVSCLFIGDSMAGKGNKGEGEDIILYNGNIVLRGSGGKGKGKGGGGSIVVANSPPQNEYMPMYNWGGFRRRR